MTVDSGACDTVTALSLCSEIVLRESEQQRNGLEYEVANGASIRNEGERRCLMMTRNASGSRRITFQVVDVQKACSASHGQRTQDTNATSARGGGGNWTSTPGRRSPKPEQESVVS